MSRNMYTVVYTFNIIILVSAIIYAWTIITRLRNTSATYNARLLPFAYYSLLSWTLWGFIYLIAIIREVTTQSGLPESLPIIMIYYSTMNWIELIQSALMAIAVLSLYLPTPPRLSLTIPLLIAFSIVAGFVCYATEIPSSGFFRLFNAVSFAAMFWGFIPAVFQLRLSKWFAIVFCLYGLAQFMTVEIYTEQLNNIIVLLIFPTLRAVLLLAWTKMILMLLQRAQASYQRVVKEIESLDLFPNPTASFGVMISSTVDDLLQERDAADKAIQALHLDRFRAETFGSLPYTPRKICEFMAKQCDLFILLIGQRYGYLIEPEGISVVQFEYQTARAQNPQKILVYVKNGFEREPRLQKFLQEVQNFECGYFRSSFDTPEELFERIHIDIARWLVSQAKQKLPAQPAN